MHGAARATAKALSMTQSRLRTLTLGCKVNQYETEFVRQGLVDAGAFRDANQDEAADLCVVNTCTDQRRRFEKSTGDS